jgi:eukaryotic-like serine/threonine-protein kinase
MTAGQPRPLAASDPRQLGRFQVLGLLGEGGMGRVFLGRSPGGRMVAIKVIHAGLAADPAFRTRFAHEVATARAVGGFYTAPVVDADTNAERPWLAVAYVDGPSLADAVMTGGPLPPHSVRRLGLGLGEALQAIHAAGVIHRDLKPSNVLLAADGPRVIDFGIARAADRSSLTRTGTILGSAGFMAPEQITGEEIGPAADVFALGAVLTFAASGTGPFGEGRTEALAYRVVHVEPSLEGLPDPFRVIAALCLAKDPQRRPRPAEVITALAGIPAAEPGTGQSWLPEPVSQMIGLHQAFGAAAMSAPPTEAPPAPVTAAPAAPVTAAPAAPTAAGAWAPAADDEDMRTRTALASGSATPPPAQWAPQPGAPQWGPPPGPQQWGAGPPPQRPGRRPPGWVFGLVALVIVLAASGAVAAVKLSAKNNGTTGQAGGGTTSASAPQSTAAPSTASASPTQTATATATATATTPAGVVQAYYAAINNHNCNAAWRLGGDNISAANGQSYQQFCQGFSNTSHDYLTVNSVSGNTVNVSIVAQQTDGSSKNFTGSYVVGNGVIQSASIQGG